MGRVDRGRPPLRSEMSVSGAYLMFSHLPRFGDSGTISLVAEGGETRVNVSVKCKRHSLTHGDRLTAPAGSVRFFESTSRTAGGKWLTRGSG